MRNKLDSFLGNALIEPKVDGASSKRSSFVIEYADLAMTKTSVEFGSKVESYIKRELKN